MVKKRFARGWNSLFVYIFSIMMIAISVFGVGVSGAMAAPEKQQDRKAVVLILDEVSLEEIEKGNTPNIDKLIANGATGLMNIRSKSSVSNKGSNYLSLGMGTRTLASIQGGDAFGADKEISLPHDIEGESLIKASDLYKLYTGKSAPNGEIINTAFGDITRAVEDVTPNYEIGLLGKTARENGLSIGLIGNSDLDKPAREATMIAMDEKGAVPFGAIDEDILVADSSVFGGIRIDQEAAMKEVDRILPSVDMLFIDYGDTVRTDASNRLALDAARESQKIKAIERADSFLGQIIEKVDDNTLFMIIAPNPSKLDIADGNFGLTPVVVSGGETGKGLLTSSSTRREGLVANFDFAPTLLSHFKLEKAEGFGGDVMSVSESENPVEELKESKSGFLYLRGTRYIFHWSYIALVMITLLAMVIGAFTKLQLPRKPLEYLKLTVLAMPFTMMTVPLIGYRYIALDLAYVVGGAFAIAYILKRLFKSKLSIIAFTGLATSALLIVDTFFMGKLMIVSPLGSDSIAGGRFYGIGNDYMGILMGSAIIGLFSLFQIKEFSKTQKFIASGGYMLLSVVALSPFFGANMGGTLSAMLITMVTLLAVLEKKVSFKKLILLGLGVFSVLIAIAALDLSLNPNPTHAGKALEGLVEGGSSKFLEIAVSKLTQVFWNLFNASWKIVLLLQIVLGILAYRFKRERINDFKVKYPEVFKGITIVLFGAAVIFVFNDTGTIAASLAMIYLYTPFALLEERS